MTVLTNQWLSVVGSQLPPRPVTPAFQVSRVPLGLVSTAVSRPGHAWALGSGCFSDQVGGYRKCSPSLAEVYVFQPSNCDTAAVVDGAELGAPPVDVAEAEGLAATADGDGDVAVVDPHAVMALSPSMQAMNRLGLCITLAHRGTRPTDTDIVGYPNGSGRRGSNWRPFATRSVMTGRLSSAPAGATSMTPGIAQTSRHS